MLDYAGLEALAAVLREGSFERAARKLHVTPSAISQRIKLLEERVGQVLVMRGSPCTGTEAGRRLCLHVEQVALLENELRRNNPELVPEGQVARPTLKLAVNADSLNSWFVDAMADFTQGGNELLDISIDDQDHTAKRINNLDKSGKVHTEIIVQRNIIEHTQCIHRNINTVNTGMSQLILAVGAGKVYVIVAGRVDEGHPLGDRVHSS